MTFEERAKLIVAAVVANLEGRAGFDEWWDQIDSNTRQQIIKSLTATVLENLPP